MPRGDLSLQLKYLFPILAIVRSTKIKGKLFKSEFQILKRKKKRFLKSRFSTTGAF